jgi:hypothetical protein
MTEEESWLRRVLGWPQRHAMSLACLLVLGTLLGLHAHHYWPFLSDDALISLRYGRRLAEGHGLTWTGQERVEGYTNLLWVLFAAGAHLVRLDPIWVARILDFAGALGAILFVSLEPSAKRIAPLRALSGGLALALCAPLAVWAIGGLEHGFMTGVLAASLVLLRNAWEKDRPPIRPLILAATLLGVLCLSRADGMVLAATCLAGLAITRKPSLQTLRSIAIVAAIPAALLALQLLFRVLYYGEFVPNTALVKVAFNTHRLMEGLRHVGDGFTPLIPLLVLVVGAVAVSIRRIPVVRWGLPMTVAVGWSAYVVLVGGDIFPGWRQLLLGIIPLAMVVAEGAQAAGDRWPRRTWAVAVIALPTLALGLYLQTTHPENKRADDEMWEWDGYVIGPMLRIAFGDKDPLLAVDAAGALPYWSRLPSLDMLGLNDKHIAKNPPPTFGKLGIGHELGDGAYVLERSPDIIAFNNAAGARDPHFLSGRQMIGRSEFTSRYQLIRVKGFRLHEPIGELWLRREDGVLGVTRSEDRIDIPGYFFAGGNALAILHERQLFTEITARAAAKLPSLTVPPGRWQLAIEPPNPQIDAGVHCGKTSAIPTGAGGPLVIEVSVRGSIDILLGSHAPGSMLVQSASLVRTDEEPTHRCGPSSGPLTISIRALSNIQPERSDWAHPTNVVFTKTGVFVELPKPHSAPAVHLSLDNNDQIKIQFRLDNRIVGQGDLKPKPGIVGMASHRVEVPEEARLSGYDAIRVVPVDGDGNYSLGHLVLLAE